MAKIDPTKQPGTGDEEYNFTFKEAFAAARKAGRKTFTWNGKSYHTKTSEEVEEEKYKGNKPKLGGYQPLNAKKMLEAFKKRQKKTGGFLEPGIESID